MPHTLNRILIGIDDSEASEAAVEEGIALAVDEGAEIVFAHVVDIPGEQFVPGSTEPDRVPGTADVPAMTAAEARAALAAVTCRSELLIGYPARQLALVGDDLDVDLIVVGSRRLRGVKRVLLGSTSRALLAESTRPVLVVPYVRVAEAAGV